MGEGIEELKVSEISGAIVLDEGHLTINSTYYLNEAAERFCRYLAFFSEDEASERKLLEMTEAEIDEALACIHDLIVANGGYADRQTEINRFGLQVAKLKCLSEKRIALNDIYFVQKRQLTEREHKDFYQATKQSGFIFMELVDAKDKKFLHLKDNVGIHPDDINTVLLETISEIYKIPVPVARPLAKIDPASPEFEGVEKSAKNEMMKWVYLNRAEKSGQARKYIDCVESFMLTAAARVVPDPVLDNRLEAAIRDLSAAGKAETKIPENSIFHDLIDHDFDQKREHLQDLMKEFSKGHTAKFTWAERVVIEVGVKLIEYMSFGKYPLKNSVEHLEHALDKLKGHQGYAAAI